MAIHSGLVSGRRSGRPMRYCYEDILERAGPPKWFDESGVPRYCRFRPESVANVFACEATLACIACRECGQTFNVAFSRPKLSPVRSSSIAEDISDLRLTYGTPPNVKCCNKGAFIGSVALRILEYWRKLNAREGWLRDRRFEVEFILPFPKSLFDRATELVQGVEINLDVALPGDDDEDNP
jgi:hypothetical protein